MVVRWAAATRGFACNRHCDCTIHDDPSGRGRSTRDHDRCTTMRVVMHLNGFVTYASPTGKVSIHDETPAGGPGRAAIRNRLITTDGRRSLDESGASTPSSGGERHGRHHLECTERCQHRFARGVHESSSPAPREAA